MAETSFAIRPIEPRNDAAVAAIIRRVMPEFGADGPGFAIHDAEVDAMSAAYARARAAYFVIELDGSVQGGAGVAPLDGGEADVCELRKMYFLPALRGRGAGAAVIARCIDAARAFGFRRCYIETLTRHGCGTKALSRERFPPHRCGDGRDGPSRLQSFLSARSLKRAPFPSPASGRGLG
jgi:putative acetyltransferase